MKISCKSCLRVLFTNIHRDETNLSRYLLRRLFKNPLTTPEIKASVEDLKVLGKKDFKILLKYRMAIREDVSRYQAFRCRLIFTYAHWSPAWN